jgi:hypothetical protein
MTTINKGILELFVYLNIECCGSVLVFSPCSRGPRFDSYMETNLTLDSSTCYHNY